MNCKPGDLARFVRTGSINEGKVVSIVGLHPESPMADPAWIVDPCLPYEKAGAREFYTAIFDKYLRPIADPGELERDERDTLVPIGTNEALEHWRQVERETVS